MERLIIHIGLHKTGTSFLQQILFPKIPSVEIVQWSDSQKKFINIAPDKKVIISNEGMSGRLWYGSYFQDFKTNIKKIKSRYNNPKIIFGIRNQATLLPSLYKQSLQERRFGKVGQIFNVKNTGLLKREDFLMMPRIKLLEKEFSDVFVYSQEDLKKREQDFTRALFKFLKIKYKPMKIARASRRSNISISTNLQISSLRKLNILNHRLETICPALSLYSPLFHFLRLTPRHICQGYLRIFKSKKFEFDQGLTDFIKSYYSDDWKEASKKTSF
jgi:hypothetical protein